MTTSESMATSGRLLEVSRPPDTDASAKFSDRIAKHRSREWARERATSTIRTRISLLNTRTIRGLPSSRAMIIELPSPRIRGEVRSSKFFFRTQPEARCAARAGQRMRIGLAARLQALARWALRQGNIEGRSPDQARRFSNCPQTASSAASSAPTASDRWALQDRCKGETWT
jgi:hypothetical protein